MLESIIDLLNGLFFIATISLTAVCVIGSIVVALRAVGRETAISESIHRNLVDDTQPVERPVRTHVLSVDSVLGSVDPEKAPDWENLNTFLGQGRREDDATNQRIAVEVGKRRGGGTTTVWRKKEGD